MGWAYCGKDDRGREIGYGITATCDRRGCDARIDRGLGCVCGGRMHGTEGGCGRYYCDPHGGGWGGNGERGGRCQHRGRFAWGKTKCQPLWADGAPGSETTFSCACGQWSMRGRLTDRAIVIREEYPWQPSVERGFNGHLAATGGWGGKVPA